MTETAYLNAHYPLLGLQFPHTEIGRIDGLCAVFKPYPEDWKALSRSDVWHEVVSSGKDWIFDEHNIPTCLHLFDSYTYEDSPMDYYYKFVDAQKYFNIQKGKDYVLILRLFKEGWFFDPFFYQICFSGDKGMAGRQTGPYRQIDLGRHTLHMPDFYHLSLDDLGDAEFKKADAPVFKVAGLVARYRQAGSNSSCDYALHHFEKSYSLFMPYAQKCGFLFTAIDTLFGGMSAMRIYETALTKKFLQRLGVWMHTYPHSERESQWLNDPSQGGRYLRNHIAHGQGDSVEDLAKNAYTRLQNIIRHLLKVYMSFCTVLSTHQAQLCTDLAMPQNSSAAELFNVLAEQFLAGNEAAAEWRDTVLA